ncbi:MAG: hypothetical protein M5U28_23150 [Sandaracinaceae bacterium]|nr:hypothetical protein [Sandaracinaceae bacterium]
MSEARSDAIRCAHGRLRGALREAANGLGPGLRQAYKRELRPADARADVPDVREEAEEVTDATARTLFHACARIWKPGEIITTGGEENFYWQRLAREGKNAANEALDARKPGPKPSRRTCVFAAPDAGFALAFANGQGMSEVRLFTVEAIGTTHEGPMFLTTALAKHLALPSTEITAKQIDEMIAAYWNEATGWAGVEVLAGSLRVLRDATPSPEEAMTIETVARMGYADDSAQAGRRWPRRA